MEGLRLFQSRNGWYGGAQLDDAAKRHWKPGQGCSNPHVSRRLEYLEEILRCHPTMSPTASPRACISLLGTQNREAIILFVRMHGRHPTPTQVSPACA